MYVHVWGRAVRDTTRRALIRALQPSTLIMPVHRSLSSGDGRSQSAASRISSGTAVRTSSPSGADAISPLLRPISPITEIRMMEGSASGGTSQKGPPRVAASQPAAQTQRKTNGPVGVVIRGRQIGHPSAAAQYGVVPGF